MHSNKQASDHDSSVMLTMFGKPHPFWTIIKTQLYIYGLGTLQVGYPTAHVVSRHMEWVNPIGEIENLRTFKNKIRTFWAWAKFYWFLIKKRV